MLRQAEFASHPLKAARRRQPLALEPKFRYLDGILAPFVILFKDGEGNHEALALRARALINEGSRGLLVAGISGEIDSLSLCECLNAARIVITATAGLIPPLVGNREGDATASGREIAQFDQPLAGFLLPGPELEQSASRNNGRRLINHCLAAADVTDRSIILFDWHSRSGQGLTSEIMESIYRTGRFPTVVLDGRSAELLPEQAELNMPKVLCGSESWLFVSLQIGGHGGMLPIANLMPEVLIRIHDLFMAGQHDAAWPLYRSLLGLCERCSGQTFISALKPALALDQAISPEIRPPEPEADLSASSRIRSELHAFRRSNLAT